MFHKNYTNRLCKCNWYVSLKQYVYITTNAMQLKLTLPKNKQCTLQIVDYILYNFRCKNVSYSYTNRLHKCNLYVNLKQYVYITINEMQLK